MEMIVRPVVKSIEENESILNKQINLKKLSRGDLGVGTKEAAIDLSADDDESTRNATILPVVQTRMLVDLTRSLDDYNKVCDDTIAGPTASFSYQADGDGTVHQADDIENVEFVYMSDDDGDTVEEGGATDGDTVAECGATEGDQTNPKQVKVGRVLQPESSNTDDDGDSLLMQVLQEQLTELDVVRGFPDDLGLPAGGGAPNTPRRKAATGLESAEEIGSPDTVTLMESITNFEQPAEPVGQTNTKTNKKKKVNNDNVTAASNTTKQVAVAASTKPVAVAASTKPVAVAASTRQKKAAPTTVKKKTVKAAAKKRKKTTQQSMRKNLRPK
jgi:hypothetical protein